MGCSAHLKVYKNQYIKKDERVNHQQLDYRDVSTIFPPLLILAKYYTYFR